MPRQTYRLLVTGATGKQGGALVRALLSSQASARTASNLSVEAATQQPELHVVALTRNSSSATSQRLAAHASGAVDILQGDLSDVSSIFHKAVAKYGPRPFDGVFSVQVPLKPKVEEEQGKALVIEAIRHGVSRFVYTSADRGINGDTNPTKVAHFRSKFNIERFLKLEVEKSRLEKSGNDMKYTIIRPVAFMENLTNDFLGRAFQSMWDLNGPQSKLKLVSSEDVGRMASQIFLDTMFDIKGAEKEWDSKAINLAGDELSPDEARKIFRKVIGIELPSTYPWLARVIKWALKEQLGDMFDFFVEDGFGADVQACRQALPEMMTFETWLRKSSAWKEHAEPRKT